MFISIKTGTINVGQKKKKLHSEKKQWKKKEEGKFEAEINIKAEATW